MGPITNYLEGFAVGWLSIIVTGGPAGGQMVAKEVDTGGWRELTITDNIILLGRKYI
jgi:hypothetical protein